MNTEAQSTQTETVQPQPKSKRLSSLIWIGVLWGLVRLVAGMDGISWTRAFDTVGTMLGLWPATVLLGIAAAFPYGNYQSKLRLMAFLVVLGSFFLNLVIFEFIKENERADALLVAIQWGSVICLLLYLVFDVNRKGRTNV